MWLKNQSNSWNLLRALWLCADRGNNVKVMTHGVSMKQNHDVCSYGQHSIPRVLSLMIGLLHGWWLSRSQLQVRPFLRDIEWLGYKFSMGTELDNFTQLQPYSNHLLHSGGLQQQVHDDATAEKIQWNFGPCALAERTVWAWVSWPKYDFAWQCLAITLVSVTVKMSTCWLELPWVPDSSSNPEHSMNFFMGSSYIMVYSG